MTNGYWEPFNDVMKLRPQLAKFIGPTWGSPGSCRPQMGPMLATRTLLSGTLSTLPALWDGYPPVSYWGFPLTRDSDAGFWYFIWCQPRKTVEHIVECHITGPQLQLFYGMINRLWSTSVQIIACRLFSAKPSHKLGPYEGTNFSEILIMIQIFSFNKKHLHILKMEVFLYGPQCCLL